VAHEKYLTNWETGCEIRYLQENKQKEISDKYRVLYFAAAKYPEICASSRELMHETSGITLEGDASWNWNLDCFSSLQDLDFGL